MTVSIRPAEERDASVVASFTTNTFSWGDYVAESFPQWLTDPDTRVGVATDESDRPVALARARMLSDREGWLSAARVHPDHRRRGIGSALNEWCVEWVRRQGGLVVRLQIETWNEAAHNQVLALGYRPVADVVNASRDVSGTDIQPTTNGGRRKRAEDRLDRAPRAEAEGAYIAWSSSDLARASHGLFPVEEWAWRRMAPADAHSARAWFCPSGWIMGEEDEGGLVVRWLVSTPEDAPLLVRAAVDLAQERQMTGLRIAGPSVDWLERALEENCLEIHHSRLYEKPLPA